MIIILEGCDGSGKTVLANALAKKYSFLIRHTGRPPAFGDLLIDYVTALLKDRYARPGVVFDRLAFGELVYGPIFRGASRLTEKDWSIFRSITTELQAMHVLCMPPYDVCRENWHAKREDYIKSEALLKKVYEDYIYLTPMLGPDLIYDYTHDIFPKLEV